MLFHSLRLPRQALHADKHFLNMQLQRCATARTRGSCLARSAAVRPCSAHSRRAAKHAAAAWHAQLLLGEIAQYVAPGKACRVQRGAGKMSRGLTCYVARCKVCWAIAKCLDFQVRAWKMMRSKNVAVAVLEM